MSQFYLRFLYLDNDFVVQLREKGNTSDEEYICQIRLTDTTDPQDMLDVLQMLVDTVNQKRNLMDAEPHLPELSEEEKRKLN